MMVHSFPEEYKIALEAAVVAGREIMEFYGGELGTRYKEDESPVTLADQHAHNAILNRLKATGIPVISEEMNLPDFNTRRQWERYWLVDPLDGTKEFIRGGEDFTVNIALMEGNNPKMGIILLPFSKEVYLGDKGNRKAWKCVLEELSEHALTAAQWHPLPGLVPGKSLGVVVSRSHLNTKTMEMVEQLYLKYGQDKVKLKRRGSAAKFCMLAEGKAQLYPRFSPCMEWDTAAGQAICEALGAVMVRMDDRLPLAYNKPDLLNPAFLLQAPGIDL